MTDMIISQIDASPEEVSYSDLPTSEVVETTGLSVSPDEEAKPKFLMTGTELGDLPSPSNRYLLEPFFPSIGTVLIAGQPDTGKSQWARQLAIQVAHGSDTFLGFKLSSKHKKAIYVATEDDCYSCKFLLEQQHEGLGLELTENIRFAFPEGMKLEHLLMKLNAALEAEAADLIVIDSFSDVFNGSDANSNTQMRGVANAFDGLAKKHSCLVLFVHHINKNAYDKKPSQQGIQGGSGLTQKVRCALQLSPDPCGGNKRYLSVSKGNYCPAEYKQKQFELDFNTENFVFTNSGQQMVLATASQALLTDEVLTALKSKFDWVTGAKHSDVCTAIEELTKCSDSTAKRKVKALAKSGPLRKDDAAGLYHWSGKSTSVDVPQTTLNDSEEPKKSVAA